MPTYVAMALQVAHYFRFNESAAMLRSLLPHRRCGNATKDIAVPPAVPTAASAAFLAAGMRPMMERPIKFYFVGSVPGSNSEGFNRASDDELGRVRLLCEGPSAATACEFVANGDNVAFSVCALLVLRRILAIKRAPLPIRYAS